jgi:hypothetical protein
MELAFLYSVWAILALRKRTPIHTLIADCRNTLSTATKSCAHDDDSPEYAEGGSARGWVNSHCIQHARALLKSGMGESSICSYAGACFLVVLMPPQVAFSVALLSHDRCC